jgi:hypothetical protein
MKEVAAEGFTEEIEGMVGMITIGIGGKVAEEVTGTIGERRKSTLTMMIHPGMYRILKVEGAADRLWHMMTYSDDDQTTTNNQLLNSN